MSCMCRCFMAMGVLTLQRAAATRLVWLLALPGLLAFEYHPDHATCEGGDLEITGPSGIDEWPRDKPLKCLWTDGRVMTPHVGGSPDREKASCHIADFLAELHFPEELRAIKLYMEDLYAPCFEKYQDHHQRLYFPKLQVLHLASLNLNDNGHIWAVARKMAPWVNLRELVITTGRITKDDLVTIPEMHHLDVFGLEAADVHPEAPGLVLLMLQKAPNLVNLHIGGQMRPPEHPHRNMAAKTVWQRCPKEVCSGLTTLSINTAMIHVIDPTELAELLIHLPSLRSYMLGPANSIGPGLAEKLAEKLVEVNHPLPHFTFHMWDPLCGETQKNREYCLAAAHALIQSLPDLARLGCNHNSSTLQLPLEEELDDSIELHDVYKDHIAMWGSGAPDLHPPIEETLEDVSLHIAKPQELEGALARERPHPGPTDGKSGASMNLPPPPPAKKPKEQPPEDAPWRGSEHKPRVMQYKGGSLWEHEHNEHHERVDL